MIGILDVSIFYFLLLDLAGRKLTPRGERASPGGVKWVIDPRLPAYRLLNHVFYS